MAPLIQKMHETAAFLRDSGIDGADTALILGSGLSAVADILDARVEIPYAQIPHMVPSGVTGHRGTLVYGTIGTSHVLAFCGRLHHYEGHPMAQVAYPVRILQALSVPRCLLTAAAGGIHPDYAAGDLVLVTDHINLMSENPLRGPHDPELGERFPDMSDAYSGALCAEILAVADALRIKVHKGIYAGLGGPNLETPAEYGFLRTIGADLVGMSVVPEVIVGAQAGIAMAAICVVSNLVPPEHPIVATTIADVIRTVERSVPKLQEIGRAMMS